ncbi:MAG: biotin synthase BioB [Proteobacteria bacterium]|nr:MAG: biotin synthase BioB [Pseudomonadota bacterium]QKK11132.1 MAG: biotin synthase BioB [Pseudomonadota bacterium]
MSTTVPLTATPVRHDWNRAEVHALFQRPFFDLLHEAQSLHRRHFKPQQIQVSTLLSIKTGGCPEDCGYCPQSAHFDTRLEKERLLGVAEVIDNARAAKANGAGRFCMGAAWRNPSDRDFERVLHMVRGVKAVGLETCLTLGMLTDAQAAALQEAGLDYYNHNLDTSPEYYPEVITTRTYGDRLDTLNHVRNAGLKVCCGGIIGMGESREDRVGLLAELANLPHHPESVPINQLVKIPGTPLENAPDLDPFELVRTVAVARLMLPQSYVRLSAGREAMSDELQALCFMAGANSIFHGEKLLTAGNASVRRDDALFARLDLVAEHTADHEHTGGTDKGPALYGNACVSH